MTRRIMLDLETLSTRPNAAIVSIGAVDSEGKEFYVKVRAEECQNAGLHIDAGTVMWWLGQERAAQQALLTDRKPVMDALNAFAEFCKVPPDEIWALPAGFDLVILENIYKVAGLTTPWHYRAVRCLRTLGGLYPDVQRTVHGTAHDALSDARAQMTYLQLLLSKVSP